MLTLIAKSRASKQRALLLYDVIVQRSREPIFYRKFAVKDTIDGRFDLITLHAWLVLTTLGNMQLREIAQHVTDAIFAGFEEALREQGAGDIGLGHKMKGFADAFYGRLGAYEAAGNANDLETALAKNLWRGAPPHALAGHLALYALAARESLAKSLPDRLDFGPIPHI